MLGSNDYFVPKPLNYLAYFRRTRTRRLAQGGRSADLIAQLTADGWIDLTNSRRDADLGELPIELLGLDDAHIRWHDLRVAPRTTNRFGIAVMHSPDSAPEVAALVLRPVLAGHTHGGQVCLPFVGALVTNCSMPRRLVDGPEPDGHRDRAHVARARHQQVRAVPVLVPSGGHDPSAAAAADRYTERPRDVAQLGSAQRSGR